MWGGRFAAGPAVIMEEINASIGFDKRLCAPGHRGLAGRMPRCWPQHGIIDAGGARRDPGAAWTQIEAEIEAGDVRVHAPRSRTSTCNIEQRLTELIGEPAGRLHTARSRNDQVATDFRLWVRDAIDAPTRGCMALQRALLRAARQHAGDRDAGLHPSAGGAAGHLRPPSAGLCRDARPRPRRASPMRAGG